MVLCLKKGSNLVFHIFETNDFDWIHFFLIQKRALLIQSRMVAIMMLKMTIIGVGHHISTQASIIRARFQQHFPRSFDAFKGNC